MDIELVIFDCDGVLVDSEAITRRTWAEALRELGLAWAEEDIARRFHGGRAADVVAAASAELGRDPPEDFVPAFRTRLHARLEASCKPVEGIHEALDAIRHPTCVASNGPLEKMRATLGCAGLWERFEGRIFSAYDVGSFKPDPGLFLHAAAALGARPGACVVVEDSDGGVAAARAAGMRVFAYEGHDQPLEARGATRFDDMRRLPTLLHDL